MVAWIMVHLLFKPPPGLHLRDPVAFLMIVNLRRIANTYLSRILRLHEL